MKFPIISESYLLNIFIFLFSIFVSWFCLLFGIAHLIQGRNPNIPNSEHLKGVVICIGLCVVGAIFLFVAIIAFKGIIIKLKNKKKSN